MDDHRPLVRDHQCWLFVLWEDARVAASSRDFMGLQGYLATITDAPRTNSSSILLTRLPFRMGLWLGGSDADTEGKWTWVTGPEAGTVFSQGTMC